MNQRKLIDSEQEGLDLGKSTKKRVSSLKPKQYSEELVEKEEIKDLDNIKPINHSVPAEQHTPVYKMHRWYARRPYSVFRELIKHYSNPESIILDPFCGGGVTVVEGLRLRRKAIGVDLNPLATFITRMEALSADVEELEESYKRLNKKIQNEINSYYLTRCPKCKKKVSAEWYEWSKVIECSNCHSKVVLSNSDKKRGGVYICSKCSNEVKVVECKPLKDKLLSLFIDCYSCGHKGEKQPDKLDDLLVNKIEKDYEKTVKRLSLDIPEDNFPDGDRQRDDALFQKGVTKFKHLFTKRNLITNSLLKKRILSHDAEKPIKDLLLFTFSANLAWTSSLSDDTGHAWQRHAYWLPDVFYELNVSKSFQKRFVGGQSTTFRGKKYSMEEIGNYAIEAREFKDLKNDFTYLILTQSSDNLPLPNESTDVIITDPPYGGNVQYMELSDFWTVWLKDILGLQSGVVDNSKEAITTRHTGFPTEKSIEHYRNILYQIFRECHRVLKPDRWMVMTFHNREFKVWNTIHLAAHDAGFILSEEDGMIYQPPIRNYIQTMHTRAGGSMLGDFILSFKKAEKLPKKKVIPYVEVGRRIEHLSSETVLYHKGATLSTIYMKLVPFLLNKGLLDKIKENDIIPYLQKNFEERDGKWHLKEKLEDELEDYLSKYSRMHYKDEYRVLDFVPVQARIEYLVKSYLYKHGKVTTDEILNRIFTNLINSNAADYQEISAVLNRLCNQISQKGERKVWRLKEDIERQKAFDFLQRQVEEETVKTFEESEHDLAIKRLVDLGIQEGYGCHIGRTEQRKYTEFQDLSTVPFTRPEDYGFTKQAFNFVKEIDLLWFKGDSVMAAFEVERSTTIDSGINRFRNLFVAQPNTKIEAFLVIPDSREDEAKKKINSPANRKESVSSKVGYILFSDLGIQEGVRKISFDKIKKRAN